MSVHEVRVSLPRIADAIKDPRAAPANVVWFDNPGALAWAAKHEGVNVLVGVSIAAILFWALRGWSWWTPLVFLSTALILLFVLLSVNAPRSVGLGQEGLVVRWLHRSRTFALEQVSAVIFALSAKEAEHSDHERYFNTRIRRLDGKDQFLGSFAESTVVELAKLLPHTKMTFRVVSTRGIWDMHPKETTR